jgi:hypothetical protein
MEVMYDHEERINENTVQIAQHEEVIKSNQEMTDAKMKFVVYLIYLDLLVCGDSKNLRLM